MANEAFRSRSSLKILFLEIETVYIYHLTTERRSCRSRAWKCCSKQSRPSTFTIWLPRPPIAVELGNIVLSNRDRVHLPFGYRGVPIWVELENIVLRNRDLAHLQLRLPRPPIKIELGNIVIHFTEDT